MELSRLIDKAIDLKKSGNKEFILYCHNGNEWQAGIGNPVTVVSMLEVEPEYSGWGDTPEDAVKALIKELGNVRL